MHYIHNTHSIQQLASGETLVVHSYTFNGFPSGPIIYLQGNLHGPEIFGTVLLQKFMTYLKQADNFPGTVIVVPCANPMGVQSTQYNAIVGRWNIQSGVNWNRIFPIHESWQTPQDCIDYCEQQLGKNTLSSEERLAATLRLLSANATHSIDIHTTGSACEPHVFTHQEAHKIFTPLGASVHIEWNAQEAVGAFDESCILPFQQSSPMPFACTWEVHHHNNLEKHILEDRLQKLIHWIECIWSDKIDSAISPKIYPIHNAVHFSSPVAGYYVWKKSVGDHVQIGEAYAEVFQPWDNTCVVLKAERNWILLGTYGIHAIAKGEQIAWIIYT